MGRRVFIRLTDCLQALVGPVLQLAVEVSLQGGHIQLFGMANDDHLLLLLTLRWLLSILDIEIDLQDDFFLLLQRVGNLDPVKDPAAVKR